MSHGAGSVADIPTDEYQLCDGGTPLSNDLQTLLGQGNNVPDLRNRFIVGAGSDSGTGQTFDADDGTTSGLFAPNQTGGEVAHQLTIGEMPTHNHFDSTTQGGNGPSQWGFDVDGNGSSARVLIDDGPPWNNIVGNLARGGSTFHENRPPYYALCFIIRHTAGSGDGGGSNSGGSTRAAILYDQQSSGTNGGDFNSGSWVDRTLNVEIDPESFVTFSSSNNYFALDSGTYKISWSAPAHAVDKHKSKLLYANNTSFTSSTDIFGTSEVCTDPILENNFLVQTRSFGETIVTITETTYFKVQHRCTDGRNVNGFGVASSVGDEIYTQVVIQDLSSGGSGNSGGGDTVSITASAADILSVSSGAISANDAGSDKIVFWDDSANKLTYLTVGTNLTITDTTISASGGGVGGVGIGSTTKIIQGNTEAEVVDTGSDGHFKVTTEGTERLRITSNGSVGIGTINPEGGLNPNPLFGTKLDVFKSFVGGGDGSFVGRFYGLDTDVEETSVRFITKGTGGTAADLHNASDAYLMHGISNGDTKFVFGANGNVGIGTTLPKAKLDVNGTIAIGSSIYDSNGNLGSAGQVLSSVPGIGVSWTDQTGGSSSSGGSGFVLLERKSATGSSVEFTGIPADALEITLMFEDVSDNTGTVFDVQLGTSSGYITSNYNSSSERATGDYSSDSVSSFVIRNDNANGSFQGSMIINKSSSNSYSEIGQFKKGSGSAVDCYGTLSSVSGVVDRLKVSIGSGNFDAGLIGLSYKTSGSGSGNYNSSILSANGTNELEFTDIPSWATKVTLIAENILLPQTDSDEVGSNLEFGGSSGYLAANSYAYNLHYGTLQNDNSFNSGLADVNNTPYRDAIVLYGSGAHVNYPILSQVFITFQKVKGQNKWVFEGSAFK